MKPELTERAPRKPEDVRQAKLAEIPRRYRATFIKAWTGKSRKAADRAMCIECMGYEGKEIKRCTSPGCPLYLYRPKMSEPSST